LLAACGNEEASKARFGLVFWASKGQPTEFQVIRDRATLKSGTKVGMIIERDGSCHVYIVYKDAAGKVFVLTPEPGRSAKAEGVDRLFENPLDTTVGLEHFHVIASIDPLTELESKLEAVRSGKDDGTALMVEVNRLRTEHEDTTAAASRPVPIGGRMRGTSPEDEAMQYDVRSVICYTFTIDHK